MENVGMHLMCWRSDRLRKCIVQVNILSAAYFVQSAAPYCQPAAYWGKEKKVSEHGWAEDPEVSPTMQVKVSAVKKKGQLDACANWAMTKAKEGFSKQKENRNMNAKEIKLKKP